MMVLLTSKKTASVATHGARGEPMTEERESLEVLIDQVCRRLVDAGVTEDDHESIREAAEDVARLRRVASENRRSGVIDVCRQPPMSPTSGRDVYTREEIDRLNKAAEAYFRAMKDPSFVLNKPMSGIFEPPV